MGHGGKHGLNQVPRDGWGAKGTCQEEKGCGKRPGVLGGRAGGGVGEGNLPLVQLVQPGDVTLSSEV